MALLTACTNNNPNSPSINIVAKGKYFVNCKGYWNYTDYFEVKEDGMIYYLNEEGKERVCAKCDIYIKER